MKLDKKDRKILMELDFNARAPLSEIARKIGYSKQLVKYRLNQLEKNKVLKGTYALLDPFKIGFGCYQIFLKFQNVTWKKEREILNYICRMKQVKTVVSVGGEWDIIFVVWTRSMVELESLIEEVSLRYGKYISNKYISISTAFYYFRHKYCYEPKDFPSFNIHIQKDVISLDKIEFNLVDLLNKDGRLPNIEIARKLKLSPATVQKKIRDLISKGVIKGFRIMLNESALGFFQYRLYLRLKNQNLLRINGLVRYLRQHRNALFVTKAIEKTDLEINFIVQNPREFHDIVNGLKYNFHDIFKDYDWYILYDVL
ncbi:MAG: winged helix-turn-helix transcriptional regulator [Candidatus Woesearchaeota archaeon]